MLKSFLKIITIQLFLILGTTANAHSQSIKLFFYDSINGSINGLALGGATMALQNSDDWAPARVGLGLGILYGVGTGIYDNSILPKGQQFYISGQFNDGKNSTIIVLLDTFYGAASGAALGSAFSLIADDPILDGLQYGSGAGAWIGFGFGLVDAFALARGPRQLQASTTTPRYSNEADGIVQYSPDSQHISVGFLNPSVIKQKLVQKNSVQTKYTMAMEIINMKIKI